MSQIIYSVCAPVFNEQECLPTLVDKIAPVMEALQRPWELLLTDDGSSDRSWDVILELKQRFPFIRGLKFDRNHGQTAAMAAAIRASRGEFIITLDADLQNDPQDIPRLIESLGNHDAAIGWRHDRQDTLVRRLSSRFANWFRNLVTNDGVQDTGCSLKLFRAST
ncbi:MAG TPA: glycosyltransferase family 2 protein, partial [Candidatus Ozemobacteraceae bacterium]|nr:glycosyltransferase family 2 protein [Candidatus Ozemobacteraceae bacterium]